MSTPILGITELANNQVDQFATANEAFRAIESAFSNFTVCNLATGNVTITAANFKLYFLFRASGNTVARDIVFPVATRFFAVQNTGSATLSIKLGTTTVTLAAGASAFYFADGTANGLFKIG